MKNTITVNCIFDDDELNKYTKKQLIGLNKYLSCKKDWEIEMQKQTYLEMEKVRKKWLKYKIWDIVLFRKLDYDDSNSYWEIYLIEGFDISIKIEEWLFEYENIEKINYSEVLSKRMYRYNYEQMEQYSECDSEILWNTNWTGKYWIINSEWIEKWHDWTWTNIRFYKENT